MSSSWLSANEYAAISVECVSERYPEVRVRIRKMTLGGRIELLEEIYPILKEADSMAAGETSADQVRGQLASLKVQRALLAWGVLDVSGLTVNGVEVQPQNLADVAPEELVREILDWIQGQISLTGAERKN